MTLANRDSDSGKLIVHLVGGASAALDGDEAVAVEDALDRMATESHSDLRRFHRAGAWETAKRDN